MKDTLTISPRDPVSSQRAAWTDLAGMIAAIGCAIHCAAMPFVIGYLPSLGLGWVAGESFHQWMAVICAAIALSAFIPGFRRHRNWQPIILGAFGIALLSSAAFALEPCCEVCPTSSQAEQIDSIAVSGCVACDECVSQPSVQRASFSMLSGWPTKCITPLGGIVLIAAHLLNHRFGCRCCAREKHCQTP